MVEVGHTRCEAQKFEAGTRRPSMQVVTNVMRNNRLDETKERQENERRGLENVDLTTKNYKAEVIKDGWELCNLGAHTRAEEMALTRRALVKYRFGVNREVNILRGTNLNIVHRIVINSSLEHWRYL
jgi:hypothetical protein